MFHTILVCYSLSLLWCLSCCSVVDFAVAVVVVDFAGVAVLTVVDFAVAHCCRSLLLWLWCCCFSCVLMLLLLL